MVKLYHLNFQYSSHGAREVKNLEKKKCDELKKIVKYKLHS